MISLASDNASERRNTSQNQPNIVMNFENFQGNYDDMPNNMQN